MNTPALNMRAVPATLGGGHEWRPRWGKRRRFRGRPRRPLIQFSPAPVGADLVLTDKPNIVIAHAPKYARRKRKGAAVPMRIVVGGKVADMSEAETQQRDEAADRLWQEIKQAVNRQRGPE